MDQTSQTALHSEHSPQKSVSAPDRPRFLRRDNAELHGLDITQFARPSNGPVKLARVYDIVPIVKGPVF